MSLDTLRSHWDIVVVGAGVAGSAAALRLARDGASVLLVDKSTWPRDKVCGGCINAAALRALEDCGVTDISATGRAYTRMRLASGGREASLPLPTGRALSRSRLDELIVAQATRAGACFLPATGAQLGATTSQDRAVLLRKGSNVVSVKAKLVLDCSGLGERLAPRSAPRICEVSTDAYIGVGTILTQTPSFYRAGTIHMACAARGYVGLVHAEDDRIAVAAALDPPWTKFSGGPGRAVAAILEEAGFPAWPGLLEARWRGTPRLTRQRQSLGAERVFVLGDAAGYVEPFTGEGIGWALAAASAVEPLALAALKGWRDGSVEQWSAAHRNLLRRRQRVCRGVTRVLRHPRLLAAALPVVALAPAMLAPLTGWLNHRFKPMPVQAK